MALAPFSGFHSDSGAARQGLSSFGQMPSQIGHKEEQNPNFMKQRLHSLFAPASL